MEQTLDGVLDSTIEGAVNLRDLGGLPAGDMRVRRGLIFRSGMTHLMGAEALAALARRHNVRTVIDLRNDGELADDGVAPFELVGIRHRHLPVGIGAMTEDERMARMQAFINGEVVWGESYWEYLQASGDTIREFLTTVADAESLSVVFHCTGGRDRTGVSAAMLLAVLGVEERMIAYDYARSGELLRPHLSRFTNLSQVMMDPSQLEERITATRPEAIHGLFALLREDFGSTEDYLASCGVDGAMIRELRGRLLEAA